MSKIIVYTVIMGDYEWLRPTKYQGICLTDSALPPTKGWEIRKIERKHPDSRRASRHPKMMPYKYFPDAEYTIYFDGNIRLLQSPQVIVKNFLKKRGMALFSHPQRRCIYEEAEKCIAYKKADPTTVKKQMKHYHAEGFPAEFGLTACWVIVRHNTPEVQEFGEVWWKEYLRFSCRDQLSFDFVRWRTKVEYDKISGNLIKNNSRHFRREKHI